MITMTEEHKEKEIHRQHQHQHQHQHQQHHLHSSDARHEQKQDDEYKHKYNKNKNEKSDTHQYQYDEDEDEDDDDQDDMDWHHQPVHFHRHSHSQQQDGTSNIDDDVNGIGIGIGNGNGNVNATIPLDVATPGITVVVVSAPTPAPTSTSTPTPPVSAAVDPSTFTSTSTCSSCTCTSVPRHVLHLHLLGVSFFVLFIAYFPIQSILTTLFSSSGSLSLALVYAVIAITNLLAPTIVRAASPATLLPLGSLGYLCFIGAAVSKQVWLLLLSSCILGFGSALLWASQGAMLTLLTPPGKRGVTAGTFLAYFRASAVVGNLLVGVLLSSSPLSDRTICLVFLIVGCGSTALLLLLRHQVKTYPHSFTVINITATTNDTRHVKSEKKSRSAESKTKAGAEANTDGDASGSLILTDLQHTSSASQLTSSLSPSPSPSPAHATKAQVSSVVATTSIIASTTTATTTPVFTSSISICTRVTETFRMMQHPVVRPIVFIHIAWQGMSQGYFFGAFMLLVGKEWLGYIAAYAGACSIITNLFCGWLHDRIPSRHRTKPLHVALVLYICMFGLCSLISVLADRGTDHHTSWFLVLVFVCATCFGIAFSSTDTTLYVILTQLAQCTQTPETVFSCKLLLESCGFVISFLILGYSGLDPKSVRFPIALGASICTAYIYAMTWYTISDKHQITHKNDHAHHQQGPSIKHISPSQSELLAHVQSTTTKA